MADYTSQDACIMPQGEPREELPPLKYRYKAPPAAGPALPSLPFFTVPAKPMRSFVPEQDLPQVAHPHPAQDFLPPLPLFLAAKGNKEVLIPRVEDCHALWERYAVPKHIREHSRLVADLACAMAERAKETGLRVQPEVALAAGLLHDLGKMYCIEHGGNHAQLGASWAMRETRNGAISRAVLFHVHWPWDEHLDACMEDDDYFITMAIIYADKRVKHDGYTDLDERFRDLHERYGINDYARSRIELSKQQGKTVEAAFSRRLGVPLHEYTAHSGRLVKRA